MKLAITPDELSLKQLNLAYIPLNTYVAALPALGFVYLAISGQSGSWGIVNVLLLLFWIPIIWVAALYRSYNLYLTKTGESWLATRNIVGFKKQVPFQAEAITNLRYEYSYYKPGLTPRGNNLVGRSSLTLYFENGTQLVCYKDTYLTFGGNRSKLSQQVDNIAAFLGKPLEKEFGMKHLDELMKKKLF